MFAPSRPRAAALTFVLTCAITSSGCAAIPIVASQNQTQDLLDEDLPDEDLLYEDLPDVDPLGEQEREGEDYVSRVRIDEGNTSFGDIRIGDCLDDADEMGIWSDGYYVVALSLDVVECSEPHNSEVFGIRSLEGDVFPGDDMVYTLASEQCAPLFEPYVGVPLERSLPLSYHYYGPGPERWDAGDRDALCVLIDFEGTPLVGSAAGSGL